MYPSQNVLKPVREVIADVKANCPEDLSAVIRLCITPIAFAIDALHQPTKRRCGTAAVIL